ncbi:MAG: HAMP domain-containing sensor histidine kinase [Planctomycetota bacterium]
MGQADEQPAELAKLARQALSGRLAREITCRINGLLVGVVSVATEAMTADSEAELRRALQTNADYGNRIAELVRSFQALFPEGPSHRPAGPADVTAALDRCVSVCRKLATGSGIEIKKNYGSLPWVQADISPLEQVVIELLHNALDAMSGGGTLELAAEQKGEFVAVTVSAGADAQAGGAISWPADIGEAIGLDDSPWQSERGRGKPDGAGRVPAAGNLGLAIAMSTVRQHGGEITANCIPGKTSRFIVTWPISTAGKKP